MARNSLAGFQWSRHFLEEIPRAGKYGQTPEFEFLGKSIRNLEEQGAPLLDQHVEKHVPIANRGFWCLDVRALRRAEPVGSPVEAIRSYQGVVVVLEIVVFAAEDEDVVDSVRRFVADPEPAEVVEDLERLSLYRAEIRAEEIAV